MADDDVLEEDDDEDDEVDEEVEDVGFCVEVPDVSMGTILQETINRIHSRILNAKHRCLIFMALSFLESYVRL